MNPRLQSWACRSPGVERTAQPRTFLDLDRVPTAITVSAASPSAPCAFRGFLPHTVLHARIVVPPRLYGITAEGGVIGSVGDVTDGVLSQQAEAGPHVIVDERVAAGPCTTAQRPTGPVAQWERFAPILSYTNREGVPGTRAPVSPLGPVNCRSGGILPARGHRGAGETPALLSPPLRHKSQTLVSPLIEYLPIDT